jgi:ADP-heptose:LPS heptosyltransferase
MTFAMSTPSNFLVIRRRYLGDVVLLGPLIAALRASGGRVDVAVEPAYAPILGLNPDVDSVQPLPTGILGWPRFLLGLRRRRYTHVIDLDNTERTSLISRATGASRRLVLHHGDHPVKMRLLYTDVVYHSKQEHEQSPITNYYLQALRPLGIARAGDLPRLEPREEDIATWRRFVGAQRPLVLVHPGSRSRARVWPAERFAAVCDRLQDEAGVQVVLAGGPADRDCIDAIRAKARTHVLAVAGAPGLCEFAALARVADLMLCHDSGPMHIAAAVGTPVVALLGSQNAALFPPLGAGHRMLAPRLPCEPCLAPGKCVPGDSYRTYCVRQHGINDVVAAVRASLESIGKKSSA